MLSRVADRLYWLARYLERAEDMARLINAYFQLILDLPKGDELGWISLVDIIDGRKNYFEKFKNESERNVVKFLIADKSNFGSIRFAIKAARENVRTTRDALPEETWELINELYLYIEDNAVQAIGRRHRYEFLDVIIGHCQQIHGLIESSVSRNHTYRFLKIGQLIERSDMTSRVLDVSTSSILDEEKNKTILKSVHFLWSHLLDSLSATSAYRREIGPIIEANDALAFLMSDQTFPRSITFCMMSIKHHLQSLTRTQNANQRIDHIITALTEFSSAKPPKQRISFLRLHDFIEALQVDIGLLNDAMHESWFKVATSPASKKKDSSLTQVRSHAQSTNKSLAN